MTDRIMVPDPFILVIGGCPLHPEVNPRQVTTLPYITLIPSIKKKVKARQTGSTLNFYYKEPSTPLTPGWPRLIG